MDVDCGWIDTWLVECVNSQFLLPVRKTSISPSLAIELLLDGFYRKWFWHQLIFIYVKIPFQYEHWLDIITHTRSSSYSNMRWIRKRRYVRTTCHYSVFWWFVFHGFLVICYSNKYIYTKHQFDQQTNNNSNYNGQKNDNNNTHSRTQWSKFAQRLFMLYRVCVVTRLLWCFVAGFNGIVHIKKHKYDNDENVIEWTCMSDKIP